MVGGACTTKDYVIQKLFLLSNASKVKLLQSVLANTVSSTHPVLWMKARMDDAIHVLQSTNALKFKRMSNG